MISMLRARRSATLVILAGILGVASGVLVVREVQAANTSNCYNWQYCSGGLWCKDADEHVGGCSDDGPGCESPC